MQEIKKEVILLLTKVWVWCLLVIIGIVGKFSYDITIKKKYTFATFMGTLFLAAFVGYLASVFCANKGWDKAGQIIVPIATLMSEKILQIIITHAHKWFEKAVKTFFPNKDNE